MVTKVDLQRLDNKLYRQICKLKTRNVDELPLNPCLGQSVIIDGVIYFYVGNDDWVSITGIPPVDEIPIVDNYSALPDPTTVPGELYYAEDPQGTSWLPGSLGGTYYSDGLYYSNGVEWKHLIVPYQATQAEVNAGVIDNKFVTPATLENFARLINTSGTNTGDETTSTLGTKINAATAATPNDTDLVATVDTSVVKKITWTNVKAFLKTYFDTLYQATGLAALKANNLSDLASASTARTNLGLGNVDDTSDVTKNAATVTLTNKSISGANNTLTNISQSSVTNLTTDLAAKLDSNTAITAATKTKITYDADGLVTSGADATTADIADSLNKRYVTDANLVTIGNQASGTYSPTASNEANLLAAPTMTTAIYTRTGSVVTISGQFTADPILAATTTEFYFTLPVASNFVAASNGNGTAFCGDIAGMGAQLIADAASDKIKIKWVSSDISSRDWSYICTYIIL